MTGRRLNDAKRIWFPVPFGRQPGQAHNSMIRLAAGASGFLTLIQFGDRRGRAVVLMYGSVTRVAKLSGGRLSSYPCCSRPTVSIIPWLLLSRG
jgi:hypothetical protein